MSLRGCKSPNRYVPGQAIRREASVAVLILPEASDGYVPFGLHVAYTTTPPSTTIVHRSLRIQLHIAGDTSDVPAGASRSAAVFGRYRTPDILTI